MCAGMRYVPPVLLRLSPLVLASLMHIAYGGRALAAPDWIVKRPDAQPAYAYEIEPHLIVGSSGPPGGPGGTGWGGGLRANFVLSTEGFSSAINDLLALGVAVQVVRYDYDNEIVDRCARFELAPDGTTRVCVDLGGGIAGRSTYIMVPVVLHWSVFLTPKVSVFAEPGLNLYRAGGDGFGVGPSLSVGGRFHVSEAVWLTLRLGSPSISLGVAFAIP